VKDKLPGDAKEAKKEAEVAGQDARGKADQLAKDAKAGVDKVDAQLESLRRDAAKELDKTAKNTEQSLNKAVDKFDKSVTEVSVSSAVFLTSKRCDGGVLIADVFFCRARAKRRVVFPAGSAAVARRSSRSRIGL
jgi:F0F1-type ATP synthase membrane subunit b/b'